MNKIILEKAQTDPRYAAAALMVLYRFQNVDERLHRRTIYQNGRGFNATDADILTSFARQYEDRQYLSEKQVALLRKKLPTYHAQIPEDLEPIPITTSREEVQKKEGKSSRPAAKQEQRVDIVDDLIQVRFPYDPKMIQAIKAIQGRRWNPKEKFWTVPNLSSSRAALRDLGFDCPEPKPVEVGEEFIKKVESSLVSTLRPFQMEGVQFLEKKKGRALLADEMGLGKTIQAIAWIASHPEARPVTVICPASLKLNWCQEFMKHAKINAQIGSGQKTLITEPYLPNQKVDKILVINYDIAQAWEEAGRLSQTSVLVMDESHYIKNSRAKRTKAIRKVAKKAKHILALTGTPIVNRPIELFTTLNLLAPFQWGQMIDFGKRYCNGHHNGFGWDFRGASNTGELNEKLSSSIMIRRKKRDVLTELPNKERVVVELELQNRGRYTRVEEEFLAWVQEARGDKAAWRASQAEALTKASYLKQVCAEEKMKQVFEWVGDFLESGKKLVLFCTHTAILNKLMERFSEEHGAVKIDGTVSGVDRQIAVDLFQSDPNTHLLVGNLRAAGVGLTLTAADTTAFAELGWTPGEHSQAEDRVHRIGQEAESISAYYLVSRGTIEEVVLEALDTKRTVIDEVVDGGRTSPQDMLSQILFAISGKKG
jgi:SWI/SNF-related matrix-associated actin-dependent regulator of chromatin subfamily A-like protein 1